MKIIMHSPDPGGLILLVGDQRGHRDQKKKKKKVLQVFDTLSR